MSCYTLNERIKIDFWEEFKAVREEISEIAETVRREFKRNSAPIESVIAKRYINKISAPIHRIFNYRCVDDTMRELLSSTIQKLQLCALEIERFWQNRFVDKLRRIADVLLSFLPKGEGVQLVIIDDEKYHDTEAETNSKTNSFLEWRRNFLSKVNRYCFARKQNIAKIIINSFSGSTKLPRQLSIRFNQSKKE